MTIQNLHKLWQVGTRLPSNIEENLLGYHPILRQLLWNRGFATHEDARAFLLAQPPAGTETENMLGIPQAIDRIRWALRHAEPIAIYGDYDTDGVTATALLTEALQSLGAEVRGYIPNRFDEGYGLNNEALRTLFNEGVRLVITVDCGIRSIHEAEYAKSLGLDLIITDHHQPGAEIPIAVAVINPKQATDVYPEKNLAGVGLAYKLASALIGKEGNQLGSYMDLVALGTVADLAPLSGENRALVREGIKSIQQPQRQGLMALIGVSGLRAQNINAMDIGFALGPRLNAAGRLDSALAALGLLLTNDIFEAGQLAQKLEVQNRERQQITREIQAHAEAMVLAENPDALLLFAVHPNYNSGVVGLAASRLMEHYYRPAIVAQKGEQFTRGSCRSIAEFHITNALDQCKDLLDHHGGHAAAAGFTVRNENLPELKERLTAIAQEQLGQLNLKPTLKADMEVRLADLGPDLLKHLKWLQPTGFGNPQACFVSRDLKVRDSRVVGKDGAHLKLVVTDGYITFDAIAFRQGHWQAQIPPRLDLMYTFELNEFNGRSSLQLNVRDLKPTGLMD